MRWRFPEVNAHKVARLAGEMNVSPLLARLLVCRGLEDDETADRFLRPRLDQLHDPFLMADMRAAVERLRRAIERREKILVYGDYDVDGAMAVVVLLTALRSLGAKVEAYVPHRLHDGYGMRIPVIEQAAAEGFSVVISVDTGIREHEVIGRGRELGIDCIVTDHHLPSGELPQACAVVNPRRTDCAYPDKNLCGVGVAFKLVQGLLGRGMSEALVKSYLKIVAIGTVADVVPLVGENRVVAAFGIDGLRRPVQPGLEALLGVAGFNGKPVSAGDVAFRIAPRLNAAGRMEDARQVVELLTTCDASRARGIAEGLEALNRERQEIEEQVLAQIAARMEKDPDISRRYSLVFAGEGWHRGVIGIVAQRVVERTHRPALVIGIQDGIGQGSGRSIAKVHLLNALAATSDLFDRYGGHAQAAGFTLPADRISDLETRFEAHVGSLLTPDDLEPTLRVDAEIALGQIDWKFREEIQRLQPFGCGNPTPTFVASDLSLAFPPCVLQEKHLKLRVSDGRKSFDAIWWREAARGADLPSTPLREAEHRRSLAPGQRIDAAFTLDENAFEGLVTLQLNIRDIRSCARTGGATKTAQPHPEGFEG